MNLRDLIFSQPSQELSQVFSQVDKSHDVDDYAYSSDVSFSERISRSQELFGPTEFSESEDSIDDENSEVHAKKEKSNAKRCAPC